MRMQRIGVMLAIGVAVVVAHPGASGPVGFYGVIERVVFEPADGTPDRVQLWGAFAYVDGGAQHGGTWSAVQADYLYFRVPSVAASQAELVRREWKDLQSVAGTPQAVGFGRWGYIGRFDDAVKGAGPPAVFLEAAPQGGTRTDLRIRPASEAPAGPAAYQTNAGVVRLASTGSHAELVAQLRAAVKR